MLKMTVQRNQHTDVAKGILILLVIFYHLPQVGNKLCGLNSEMLNLSDSYSFIIKAFFMQAFFVITGLYSSFNKPITKFLITCFKTIIVAGILLNIVDKVIGATLDLSFYYVIDLKELIRKCINFGTPYWFLTSLFCCKMFLYGLLRLRCNKYLIASLSILSMIIGVYYKNIFIPKENNYWYIHNSLFMFFFLYLGYFLKNKAGIIRILKLFSPFIYFLVLTLLLFLRIDIPTITQTVAIYDYIQLPYYIVLGITGSFSIFLLSERIHSRLLAYLGRNSIIIYCTHISVLCAIEKIITHRFLFPNNFFTTFSFYFLVLVFSIILSIMIIQLIHSKYLKWVLCR